MTIYDKVEKRYELKVKLPVAFARMLLEAMSDDQRLEMEREARQKGIDLDDMQAQPTIFVGFHFVGIEAGCMMYSTRHPVACPATKSR